MFLEFCKLGVEEIHGAKAHVDVEKRGLREQENFRIPIYHALSHQGAPGASSGFEVIDSKLIGDMVRLIG